MRIAALEATDFRNLERVVLEPHPRFNVLAGDNGQGKTNLLEAVYLLGTLRSFRAARTEELIRFGAERARVRARVERLGSERLCEVELRPGGKSARLDGKHARSSQYFGGCNVVLFAPEDLRLVRGAPAMRRRFLDRAVFGAQPSYLAEAQTYDRLLRSRNALLRAGAPDLALLEVYDGELARAAVPIVTRRRRFVEELAPRVRETFARVTGGLSLEIAYQSALDLEEARVAERLGERLHAERRRDLARGATSSGPHTDDLALTFEGREAGPYASQGQLRAMVLALKIAEIEHLHAALGDPPILLLDDVSSELDATRNAQLFDFLREVPSQAFITTTHRAHVLLNEERQDYQVLKGVILVEKGGPAC